jgi:hypothetical protein
MVKAGGETCSEIHKLICFIWNKELPQQWKESIIVPIHKKGDMTDCNNYRIISLLSNQNCNFASCAVWLRNLVSHFEGGT